MSTSQSEVSTFPHIRAIVRSDGSGDVVIAGNSRPIDAPDENALRREAMRVIASQANILGRPVRVYTEGPEGDGELVVHPDGNVEEVLTETKGRRRDSTAEKRETSHPEATIDTIPRPTSTPAPREAAASAAVAPTPITTGQPVVPAKSASIAPTRRSLKETSFLVSDPVVQPATRGLRGAMTRLGFPMGPSADELAERADIHAVSQHWPGPRTIAVVNRKGGANKTPTVAALAAVFARYGGGGVLAWDNNENQGTLGWRTEQGPHTSSVLDLLRDKDQLLSPLAHNALLAHYVHHQTEDKYDVLRSDENDEGDHEISADEVDSVHTVAAKYYRMIVMDSGNTARAANWRAMIGHTDQLVIPTTTMEDRAEAAKLTLQTLAARDEHSAMLAENAVVIISQWKVEDGDEARRIADGFAPLVRRVVTVPYDPALKAGRIRHTALKPATQRAWLAAAAAVAQGL